MSELKDDARIRHLPLFSLKEVAEMYGVTVRQVSDWRVLNRLPWVTTDDWGKCVVRFEGHALKEFRERMGLRARILRKYRLPNSQSDGLWPVVLTSPNGSPVPIGVTVEDLQEYQAAKSGGDKGRVTKLLSDGRVFLARCGTEALGPLSGFFEKRVRLVSGRRKGQEFFASPSAVGLRSE